MKFKEFSDWCNQRACDGCWGPKEAMVCITCMGEINNLPFWKRNKVWHELYEDTIVNGIVEPINEKMRKMGII